MLKRLCLTFALVTLALPGLAQDTARTDPLYEALALDQTIAIMREEGVGYGRELQAEMFPGNASADWDRLVAAIYDPARLAELFRARFEAELAGDDLAPMLAFHKSPRGQRIIALEVSARRALLDEAVEEAAGDRLEEMVAEEDPRLELLREFAEVNELVDLNVVSGMNSNYAFYIGLVEGGAFPQELTEEQILADVWSQEPEIRFETEEWLYSYLALAYQPLSDEDLIAYTEFSRTDAGRALNQALFAAFDVMFADVSGALGRGAAQFMQGEDI